MAMQIGPTKTGKVALSAGTIVSQEKDGIANNVLAGVLDSDVVIRTCNLLVGIVVELLVWVVGEDNEGRGRLEGFAHTVSKLPKADGMELHVSRKG